MFLEKLPFYFLSAAADETLKKIYMVLTDVCAHPKSISSPRMKCRPGLLIPSECLANNRQSTGLTRFTPNLRFPLLWKIARIHHVSAENGRLTSSRATLPILIGSIL
jgi:hypothetical protein